MQEFKTKFTTDISQHQRVMGRLRASFKTTMSYAQKMISITGLAGLAGGGIGITMLGKKLFHLVLICRIPKLHLRPCWAVPKKVIVLSLF